MVQPTPNYRNKLLLALASTDRALLEPHLRPIVLGLRDHLERPGQPITRVYFIEEGIASVVTSGPPNDQVEIGLIGPEGMTGVAVLLGNHQSPNAIFIQAAGSAFAINVEPLRRAIETSKGMHSLFLRFVQVFLTQTTQTAVANARLTLDARLARWLLMTGDRLQSDKLVLTHEFVATMLGVRRAGVTDTLHLLEGEKLINAERGLITILDRPALARRAGSLYGLPEAEYERVFGNRLRSKD